MSKKIVVITGSPRKKGNSFAMTEAFIRAAEEKGHTATRFDAAALAKLAIKRTKHAPLTMTSTPLPRRFWKRTFWSLPCRYTGIQYQRK